MKQHVLIPRRLEMGNTDNSRHTVEAAQWLARRRDGIHDTNLAGNIKARLGTDTEAMLLDVLSETRKIYGPAFPRTVEFSDVKLAYSIDEVGEDGAFWSSGNTVKTVVLSYGTRQCDIEDPE